MTCFKVSIDCDDVCLGELQFGFRKGRGTRDAIGALRMMAERSFEK